MEWSEGDKYFFKLSDGDCYNGVIIKIDIISKNKFIIIMDKYDNEIGIMESKIIKYELLTKRDNTLLTGVNNVNNSS